jgi:predicted amidohydrolase YtcJ
MLIRGADIGGRPADLRVRDGRIAALAPGLRPDGDEAVVEAQGAALVGGLHDHHLHLQALAVALASVRCGPPQVTDAGQLAAALATAPAGPDGWVRGIGYHPSVAGDIDRHWLDRWAPDRPVRVQHRSGRLWILNSAALARLGDGPFERGPDGQPTGRLYEADDWLRRRLGGQRPDLGPVSRLLASRGVTAVTDATPRNGPDEAAWLAAAQRDGALLQDVVLMGGPGLDGLADTPALRRGASKFHLHEADLPDFAAVCGRIAASHAAGRGCAFHCVTAAELAFALAALAQAGAHPGDRVEHGSVAPPALLAEAARLGLLLVTQPNFVAERGDAYLADVAAEEQAWLYPARSAEAAGLALLAGTDAPFGSHDPWPAMQAAVTRRTARGRPLGLDEALSPERALALFSPPLAVGGPADLALLDRPWAEARGDLAAVGVRRAWRRGTLIWPD